MEMDSSQNQTSHAQYDFITPPAKRSLIHGLPPEVMGIIFLGALERPKWKNDKAKYVIRMGSVCRQWREILNGMKCFWNDIWIQNRWVNRDIVCLLIHSRLFSLSLTLHRFRIRRTRALNFSSSFCNGHAKVPSS
jgi:hypothetical protein